MKAHPALLLYPVKNVAGSRDLYKKFLGVEPYVDSPYYVGFRAGDLEIGLAPSGSSELVAFWDVEDIQKSLQQLRDAGAQTHEEPRNVGGGMQVASVKDADGNVIGLRQSPSQSG